MNFFYSHFVFQLVIYKPDARLKKGFQSMKKKPELLDDWSSLTNQGEFCFLFCGTQMYITSSFRFFVKFCVLWFVAHRNFNQILCRWLRNDPFEFIFLRNCAFNPFLSHVRMSKNGAPSKCTYGIDAAYEPKSESI